MRNLFIISAMTAMAVAITGCHRDTTEATVADDVRVETTTVSSTSLAGSRVFSGTLQESGSTSVSFPVAGTIQSLNVGEGDRVSKGQLIGTLDAATIANTYEIAKATLEQAQDAYNRLKMLHDANSFPDIQWVEVQQKLKQAQSAEEIARRGLGDARLNSPVSGYVSEKFMDAGMNAAPGVPVVKIVNINPIKVSVSVPEDEIASISTGMAAQVTIKALGDKVYTGRISEKSVQANPLSRSYDVKLELANPNSELLPGMICDVVLDGKRSTTAMVLPLNAVLLDANNKNFVWVDAGGKATKRAVTTGGMTDAGIIITSGLTPGDKVITAGQQKVSEGTKVYESKK